MTVTDISPGHFDRPPDLAGLLAHVDVPALIEALETLLDAELALVDPDRRPMAGTMPLAGEMDGMAQIPLEIEFELLGYMITACESERQRQAAQELVQQVLAAGYRVRMLTELHHTAIEEDFRQLQARHEELQASEERYRQLAGELEARVKAQVEELKASERSLSEAHRLAAVGQLAAGVAHEINNPLGFVTANMTSAHRYIKQIREFSESLSLAQDLDEVREAWTASKMDFLIEDFPELLEETQEGVGRIAKIVMALRGLTDAGETPAAPMEVGAAFKAAHIMMAEKSAAEAETHMDIEAALRVNARGDLFVLAISEILSNAVLAAAETGGAVEVKAYNDVDCVRIIVADDGPGMDQDTVENAFNPFFTTRPVGSGTGLGLTVAREIIMAHSGDVTLASELGKGSRVTVTLPTLSA